MLASLHTQVIHTQVTIETMRHFALDDAWGFSSIVPILVAPSAYSMTDTIKWLGQFQFLDFGSPFNDWQLASSSRPYSKIQDTGGSGSMSQFRISHNTMMEYFQSSMDFVISLIKQSPEMLSLERQSPDRLLKLDL